MKQGSTAGVIDFEQMHSADEGERLNFTKKLLRIAGDSPDLLYPYYNICASLLRFHEGIIQWAGIDTVGMLATVDHEKKSLVQIPILLKLLRSGSLVTCNHAIYALGLIASAFPDQRKMIVNELVSIGANRFETVESNELVSAKLIETLATMGPEIQSYPAVASDIRNIAERARGPAAQKAKMLAAGLGLIVSGHSPH